MIMTPSDDSSIIGSALFMQDEDGTDPLISYQRTYQNQVTETNNHEGLITTPKNEAF